MTCVDCREEISARLDSEDDPGSRAEVDGHLDECAACRRWLDDAAHVTRLARTGLVTATPDFVEAVLGTAPAHPKVRGDTVLRVLLAAIGTGQLVLSATQLTARGPSDVAAEMAGASIAHFSHESIAWNLALAVGFLWIAARASRAAGLVPTLTAFLGVLTVLSALDLAAGHVDVTRLQSHGLVLLGYAVVVALALRGGGGLFPPARRGRATAAAPALRHVDERVGTQARRTGNHAA